LVGLAAVVLVLAAGALFALQQEAAARAQAEQSLRAFYGAGLRTVQQLIEGSNMSTAIARLDATRSASIFRRCRAPMI